MTSRLPYARLSEFYDVGWGDFAESSLPFVTTTLKDYGVQKGRILELACGTGILAIHLAKVGHTILGLDRSPEMVALAR
ncbi:class I SAM-dependent methyltransferase, partial [Candidatus Bipolaricaulota bacterium]|nr:class I SAM-dependent methyltransferase [Candidatus Bipolaricaulota bacterium]